MADEKMPDQANRDPKDLNKEVKIQFEDVFGEPEGIHSHDKVWELSFNCYNKTRSCCYLMLTCLCAIPIAFCWGCQMACLSFNYIWCSTPCWRQYMISLSNLKRCYHSFVECAYGPLCETFGLVLSKIKYTQGKE